MFLPKVISKR